jgi:hypothetical protein
METTAQQHSHLNHIQPDHMQHHHPSHDVHMHLHDKHILLLGIHSQLQDSDTIMGNMKKTIVKIAPLKLKAFKQRILQLIKIQHYIFLG